MTTEPDLKTVYAYQSADPVEALSFAVKGIPMSDFVYLAYFEDFRGAGSVKFDQLGKVNRPFQILSGGYQIIFKGGKWSQIFGSTSKKKAFNKEDRRGHRSEQRKLAKLKRAAPAQIARAEAAAAKRHAAEALRARQSTAKSKTIANLAGRKRKRH